MENSLPSTKRTKMSFLLRRVLSCLFLLLFYFNPMPAYSQYYFDGKEYEVVSCEMYSLTIDFERDYPCFEFDVSKFDSKNRDSIYKSFKAAYRKENPFDLTELHRECELPPPGYSGFRINENYLIDLIIEYKIEIVQAEEIIDKGAVVEDTILVRFWVPYQSYKDFLEKLRMKEYCFECGITVCIDNWPNDTEFSKQWAFNNQPVDHPRWEPEDEPPKNMNWQNLWDHIGAEENPNQLGSGIQIGVSEKEGIAPHNDFDSDLIEYDGYANYHGTGVMGVLGAMINNNRGVASAAPWSVKICKYLQGHRPDANHVVERRFITNQINRTPPYDIYIYNLSHTWHLFATPAERDRYYNVVTNGINRHNLIVITSNTNEHENPNAVYWPNSFPETITVTACQIDGMHGGLIEADYIDCTAPGDYIRICTSNNGYGYNDGPSYSTPQITGLAALCRRENEDLTYEQFRDRLQTWPRYDLGMDGPDPTYGCGIPDAASMIYNRDLRAPADRKISLPDNIEMFVYPNPLNAKCDVLINIENPGIYSLKLFNVRGATVLTKTLHHLNSGSHSFTLQLDKVCSGSYFLALIQKGEIRRAIPISVLK